MEADTKELADIYKKSHHFLMVGQDMEFIGYLQKLVSEFNCEFTFATTFDESVASISHIDDFDSIWIDIDLNCGHTACEVVELVKAKDRCKPIVVLFDKLYDPPIANQATPDCAACVAREKRMKAISRFGVTFYVNKPPAPTLSFFNELFGSMRVKKKNGNPPTDLALKYSEGPNDKSSS